MKLHDFTIDVMTRPSDRRTIYVARCTHQGCTWHTGELRTRARAVAAAWVHQAERKVSKL